MELRIEIVNDDINYDGSRSSDELIRNIHRQLGPDAVWEKYNQGWRAFSA